MNPHTLNIISRPPLKILLTFLALGYLSPAALFAGESWPEFRGPTGQGHSSASGLPVEWDQEKNVVWKTDLPGTGWSSPILVDGRLYLTSAIPEEGTYSMSLLELNAESGALVRRTSIFQPQKEVVETRHRKNSFASPTPIFENGRIYAHFGHMGIACVDQEGAILWKNNSFQYEPVHGNGGSPVLYKDRIIFSCDGKSDPFLMALDKNTGKILWKTPRETDALKTFSFCTPLVIEIDGEPQIISPGSNMVGAYNPENGELIWQVRYDGYSVTPRPIYSKGLLYISTGFDRPELLAIRPTGKGDVTETHIAWTANRGAPLTPSLLQTGNELYMMADRGIMTCLDASTGEKIWEERLGGDCSASPILADGKIYAQNEQGVGFVLSPGREFNLLAKNDLNERTLASYAVSDGSIFIRTESRLYRIGQSAQSSNNQLEQKNSKTGE